MHTNNLAILSALHADAMTLTSIITEINQRGRDE